MAVVLRALGAFRHYLGEEPIKVALPQQATLRELLERIDQRWGQLLPPELWDRERRYPKPPGMVFVAGRIERSPERLLEADQEVMLLSMGVGG